MDQPVTILGAIIALLFAIGGITSGFVVYKVLMGFVKGMPKC